MTAASVNDLLWPAAEAAGMVNREALDALNMKACWIDAGGRLVVPADFFAKAKRSRPHLFAVPHDPSTNYPALEASIRKNANASNVASKAF